MANDRLIRVIGTIDEEAFKSFSEQLRELELESSKDIVLELSSDGGVAYDALAFVGRMRNSPCNIIVKAYGFVASAAVIILAAGDTRLMAKEAWVMVHEDSGKVKGSVREMEIEVAQNRLLEDQWTELLASYTKTTALEWSSMHRMTAYLYASTCLRLGLVDKLV